MADNTVCPDGVCLCPECREKLMAPRDIDGEHGKYVGSVAVDSGQIIIVDPCYLMRRDGEAEECRGDEATYEHVCDITSGKGAGQFIAVGIGGIAVASDTALGEGVFPVYARYNDDGKVKSLTIVLDRFDMAAQQELAEGRMVFERVVLERKIHSGWWLAADYSDCGHGGRPRKIRFKFAEAVINWDERLADCPYDAERKYSDVKPILIGGYGVSIIADALPNLDEYHGNVSGYDNIVGVREIVIKYRKPETNWLYDL